MSDLENAVKPILRPMLKGIGRPLSRTDQTILATWATKTAMMLEFLDSQAKRPVPEDHYRYVREHQEPPPGTHVFTGAYNGSKWGHYYWLQTLALPDEANPETPNHPNGYFATVCIGQVVLQVLGTALPGFGVAEAAPDVFLRIWPFARPQKWPGRFLLGDRELEFVSQAPVPFLGSR